MMLSGQSTKLPWPEIRCLDSLATAPMSVNRANDYCKTPSGSMPDLSDTELINRLRLVLAITGLLTIFVDPRDAGSASMHLSWLVLAMYGSYGAVLCLLSPQNNTFLNGKMIYWVDLAWYTVIVALAGSIDSNFFLFFFFVILASSFHWGFEEGARVTIAATLLFAISGWLLVSPDKLPELLMRATFLLVLGYMSAYWGETKVNSLRRLTLLKDVSRLS
ncbi:MAG TPA: hypothetical protein VHK70_10825, partial [Burkholderiaceae bacterium]|nr:hypothetical protein [Burkholderiaceae bacterium]